MGNRSFNFAAFLAVIVISFSCNILAQDTSQSSPGFVIGTFTASSSDLPFTHYQNYWQVQELGVNSIHQRIIQSIPNQQSNFDSLSLFPIIFAANDSGTGTGKTYIDAFRWQNIDWISYFTNAKYRKWEAEGDPLFTGHVKVIQEHGEFYNDSDVEGYRTNNQTQVGDTIIKGPDYYQYPRYTYTQPEWNPLIIRYRADFRLKIDSPSAISVPVCSLYVTTTYYDTIASQWKEDILAKRLLTTADLSTQYLDFPLIYDYSDYINTDKEPSGEIPIFKPYSVYNSDGLSFNIGAKVHFKVQWLGNKQLFVDRVEVYDADQHGIWSRYFKGQINFNNMVDSIENYSQYFTGLGSKLKYFLQWMNHIQLIHMNP